MKFDLPSDAPWERYRLMAERGFHLSPADGHYARHDPARTLRKVEAKRLLLDRWQDLQARIDAESDPEKRGSYALTRHGLDMFVYQLAAVYDDHPDYREEWRP